MSTDQTIIKKFQPVIKALIPYQQQGKLLEGLNRFSSRLNSQARKVIKNEVERLTSLTDAPADNSEFAQFPVKRFSHFGIQMALDKVGSEILQKESARYMERYTVGVFESITNSEHYQSQIQRKMREKIIKAFLVQTQSFKDIQFNNDLSITPNFVVSTQAYQNGRSVSVVSLSAKAIVIACTRSPTFTTKTDIPVIFPNIPGLCSLNQVIHYDYSGVEFDQRTQRHNVTLKLAEQDESWQAKIKQYLDRVMLRFPLDRDLEIERAMQALDRDRVVHSSPWIPVFVSQNTEGQLQPNMVMLTAANCAKNPAHRSGTLLPGKNAMARIFKELSVFKEVFVVRQKVTQRNGKTLSLCTTIRQLEQLSMVGQFIQLGLQNKSLQIWQYRLNKMDNKARQTAAVLQDIPDQIRDQLSSLTQILSIRCVTEVVGGLTVHKLPPPQKLPRQFVDEREHWPLHFVMDNDMDRRNEPRFRIEKHAEVKVGLITSYPAMVLDFSKSGMQLQLLKYDGDALPAEVKITIADLKLKGQRYKVLHFDPESACLRLQLIASDKNEKVAGIMSNQSAYFTNIQNIEMQQKVYFRSLWEIFARCYPNAAVQIISARQMVQRLKTVYSPIESTDLYPFTVSEHKTPTHGFFADMDKSPPDSTVLKRLLQKSEPMHLSLHCERKNDASLISLTEQQCFGPKLRKSLQKSLNDKHVAFYVKSIESQPLQTGTTTMTKQRLALLSKIDLDVYEKLLDLQKNYTHVLHLIDMSALYNSLVLSDITPVKSPKAAS
ncbi:MAG: PilZ domain-containing protein [Alteromonadaceae bacterium]|nr:PilZ domain-containing protein [Alteromonadaceae bacterium]